MRGERVKFYSISDLGSGLMLEKALVVLKKYDKDATDYTFSDILELYNIQKFIEAKIYCANFTEGDKAYFSDNMKNNISKTIGIFCSKLNDSTIVTSTNDLDVENMKDYWDIFAKYKIYDRIGEIAFKKLLEASSFSLRSVLSHELIVKKYDTVLAECLIADEHPLDILITKYFRQAQKDKIYIPNSLSQAKIDKILLNYINSEQAQMNMLETIFLLPVNKEFLISDKIRNTAKEKHDLLVKDFFAKERGPSFTTEISVSFSLEQSESFIRSYDTKSLKIIVSDKWIKENLDYATLLNNFIYIFELVDIEMRITNISKPSQMGVFERIFSDNRLNNQYQTGSAFQLLNNFAIIQVAAYCEHLQKYHQIRMEDILQWFYESYIITEFGVKEFVANMPSWGSTYLEKCRTLCCEIESILKQYNVLVKDGFVNHGLIEISSKPTIIRDVGSLIKDKYFYANREKAGGVMHLLFSDQTMLNFLESRKGNEERYDCFFELICKEKVNISEYKDYQKKDIQYLIKEGIVCLDDNGLLKLCNPLENKILYDLYINEFAVTAFYTNNKYNDSLQRLKEKKWISFYERLLSSEESAYFNYYLNKAEYSNGLNLRNQYLHGTQKKRGNDEELHKIKYYNLLMLFILLTIKINDELCLYDDNRTKKGRAIALPQIELKHS